jgi:hypothetical protein
MTKRIVVFSIYFVSTRAAVAGDVEETKFLETFPEGYNMTCGTGDILLFRVIILEYPAEQFQCYSIFSS